MERLLLKLARQLDALDEASLMSLWGKYAAIASRFEPTKAWEEAALVFSLIQGKRWKNHLFNYQWARQTRRPVGPAGSMGNPLPMVELEEPAPPAEARRARVLAFQPSAGSPAPSTTDN